MDTVPRTKKSLGQHWLNDELSLEAMADAAELQPGETVLEIGPGPGALTKLLIGRADRVVAVEFDRDLAAALPKRVPASNLDVVQHDILTYDLTGLPPGYKVAANIPYYLTSNLIRVLSESSNPPERVVILIQKEVAERVAAPAGAMSLLSVTAQFYWQVTLGRVVPALAFTPPPKVDSQILIMDRRPEPLFTDIDAKAFFRMVKAGFGERRKTLRNSLSGGLRLEKPDAEALLGRAGIDPGLRAQSLTLEQWHKLYTAFTAS